MAEPRKVQFVTLSAFAAGSVTESRKRRLEDAADINFDGDKEVEATATWSDGAASGRFGKAADRDMAEAKKITVRLNLSLSEPNDHSSAEFNYSELIQNLQAKNNPPSLTPVLDPSDPFHNKERDQLQVEALAKKFENKYGNTGKRKDRMQDLIDIGFGYDETDPFIDNSEAYDELVPASLTTKLGGFYINTGTLQFRTASDSEGEEGYKKLSGSIEEALNRRKKKEANSLEDKKQRTNKVSKQGSGSLNKVTALSLHRPEKKRRKKLMKDSLCLATMLRRFTREKEEMRKRNPNATRPGLANKPACVPNANHLLASSPVHLHGNAANKDISLADLTSDTAVMTLLGSANEKELQDLLGDLDFGVLDVVPQHVGTTARENGLVMNKAAGGGALGRGLGTSGGLFSPTPLPEGLPAPLIKRIEDLRAASRQFDQEGRKKFFTLDMNNILLDIELQVQEQPVEVRVAIYSHMEAFVPCNKEALLKRLKKLSLNIQDDHLRTPLLKLKLAVCSVMPEQIAQYNMDCMAKAAKQSGEGEKNCSDEEDEDKPGRRVMGPRKKFVWDDKLRSLLCSLVRVKLSCYELENQGSLSVEDYLKAFMENEVKPLWPKGWMQARILFKESRTVHSHLTGNLVKRRVLPGPKAKVKDGLWIQKPLLSMGPAPALAGPMPANCRPLLSSPPEPICLSDSLDEDLTAPSLESISQALALLNNAAKGLCPPDPSPMSPPLPLKIPPAPSSSTPPSTLPGGYLTSSQSQHSPSKMEAPPTCQPSTTPPSTSITSSSCSPTTSFVAHLQVPSPSPVGPYGLVRGPGPTGHSPAQRHVAMVTPAHRPGLALGGAGAKLHPQPSPSPPKQRPAPTASPHQKGGVMVTPQALAKSSGKVPGLPPSSSPQPHQPSSNPHPTSLSIASPHTPHPHPGSQHPHLPQANFITPMQATLTKPSHSSNAIPIIKLTPRPPVPTPPPRSSPSPSSAPSLLPRSPQVLASQQHQYRPKTAGFRPHFSVSGGGHMKQSQASCSFASGQKSQAPSSISSTSVSINSANTNSNSNNKGVLASGSSRPDSNPPSSPSVLANHRPRPRVVGGASQGSKSGNSRVAPGTLATPSTSSHRAQISQAGSPILGSPPALPLGFGMLGGLVPVSLPFQFPSLLSFSPPGGAGAGTMGTNTSANSGYSLAQSELMDLYKSLQSGSQTALPPHLQLAFSDVNQSQGGDKRKSH